MATKEPATHEITIGNTTYTYSPGNNIIPFVIRQGNYGEIPGELDLTTGDHWWTNTCFGKIKKISSEPNWEKVKSTISALN